MKKNLLLLITLFVGAAVYAQDISILLVDDSDDAFENTANIEAGLSNNSIAYDLFDAVGSTASPSIEELRNYDLVIWHTSVDLDNLHLWNELDEDNGNLELYLEEGGNLWLIGLDFLYDRYNIPQDTFQTGDFVYDHLGIASYDAQSYGDDDNFGLPLVRPAEDQPIMGLVEINWIYPTLWWADVVTPREEASTIFVMGHDNYVFLGETAALWYDNGTSKALTFTFDLALANSQELIDTTVGSIVGFFAEQITDVEQILGNSTKVSLYPNPTNQLAQLSFELSEAAQVEIDVVNMNGQSVASICTTQTLAAGLHQFNWTPAPQVPDGLYQIRIRVNDELYTKAIALNR